MCRKSRLYLLWLIIGVYGCQKSIDYSGGALTPEEAMGSYEIAEGFQMDLFAAEPLIADPVDMAVDAWGQVYVVEMPGYPIDKSHTGRIKILKDTDGDGQMDQSILFADQLMLPNGVMPWEKGIIVTDAPYVIYFEDTDGDHKADLRDTLLSGFSLSNPHVNVNNPIYGLDNWIYLAHFGRIGTRKYEEEFGDQGSEIVFWKGKSNLKLPKNAAGKNVRFKPDGSGLEMRSVKSQYGHSFDEWGHHFLNHNQNHIYHEVIEPQYINRNPSAIITQAAADISDHGNSAEVFQITTNPDRQMTTPKGLTTSSSGLTVYKGGLFPPPYDAQVVFGAESVSNLVHVDKIQSEGASFTASRMVKNKEFLASKDSWARPVNLYVGPDGALYVLDYYRRIIEHPEWMSDEAIAEGGLYDGHTMGRIFRISPTGSSSANWTKGIELGNLQGTELISYLSHENEWWRINAQRLIVTAQDKAVVPQLIELLQKTSSKWGRLHALWTLEGLDNLSDQVLVEVLQDSEPNMRENALKIVEKRLENGQDWLPILIGLASDPSAKVRFKVLGLLGYFEDSAAKATQAQLLMRDLEDEWVQQMALTAKDIDAEQWLQTMINSFQSDPHRYRSMVRRLMMMVAANGDVQKIQSWLNHILSHLNTYDLELNQTLLLGLSEGLRRNEARAQGIQSVYFDIVKVYFDHQQLQSELLGILEMSKPSTVASLQTYVQTALRKAQDHTLSGVQRGQYLQFLRLVDPKPYQSTLEGWIIPTEEPEVQKAALEILGRIEGTVSSEFILDQWPSLTTNVRDVALSTFMIEKERVELLIQALEQGKIMPSDLGWARTVQLNQYADEGLRKRARALLAVDQNKETVAAYRAALEQEGKVAMGKEIFKANCSICHQVRGQDGVAYGPDLGTVHNWKPEDLLANIVNPSLSIAPGFDLWEVVKTTDEKMMGIIINETATAIELKISPEQQTTINRSDIRSMQIIPSMSIMPAFGQKLSVDALADLIAYLRNSYE